MKRKPKTPKEASASKATENGQITVSKPSSPASKKTASKYNSSDVRRSGRLQKIVSAAGNKRVAKEVDLTDNKVEEEGPRAEKVNSHHSEEQGGITELALEADRGDGKNEEVQLVEPFIANPTEEQIGMEEKIDYLYQTAKELKAKAAKRSVPSGTTCEDLKYKNLYIESQKKVEALTQDNIQLVKDLANSRGKNEAYEKIINDFTGKEMIVLANFERAAETVLNLSEDALKKSYAVKNASSLQPKAAAPSPAQDANKKSSADTDAPNPSPQPKITHTNAPAAGRNSKRKKTSQ
nr:Processed lymphoid-restricted membrane protein [Ipomoea batatas]